MAGESLKREALEETPDRLYERVVLAAKSERVSQICRAWDRRRGAARTMCILDFVEGLLAHGVPTVQRDRGHVGNVPELGGIGLLVAVVGERDPTS